MIHIFREIDDLGILRKRAIIHEINEERFNQSYSTFPLRDARTGAKFKQSTSDIPRAWLIRFRINQRGSFPVAVSMSDLQRKKMNFSSRKTHSRLCPVPQLTVLSFLVARATPSRRLPPLVTRLPAAISINFTLARFPVRRSAFLNQENPVFPRSRSEIPLCEQLEGNAAIPRAIPPKNVPAVCCVAASNRYSARKNRREGIPAEMYGTH